MSSYLRRLRRILPLLAVIGLCLLSVAYAAEVGTVYFSDSGGAGLAVTPVPLISMLP
ncbi:hypothetical protein KJ693_02750 [bacterium]|nr:hypothetical protein [bacterium]MBU1614210.1 hypothetical protein [bacterium]